MRFGRCQLILVENVGAPGHGQSGLRSQHEADHSDLGVLNVRKFGMFLTRHSCGWMTNPEGEDGVCWQCSRAFLAGSVSYTFRR